MNYSVYKFRWSNRHTVAAVVAGASASAIYAAYRLYRYHGYFSRAGVRPISDGDLSCEVKRAVDEYLQFHYAAAQELLPYGHSPKVQNQLVRPSTAVGSSWLICLCCTGGSAVPEQSCPAV